MYKAIKQIYTEIQLLPIFYLQILSMAIKKELCFHLYASYCNNFGRKIESQKSLLPQQDMVIKVFRTDL